MTDESGNSATCTADVTVQDTTPPDAVCLGSVASPFIVTLDPTPAPGPYVQPPTNAPTPLNSDLLGIGSSDNCGTYTTSSDRTTVNCGDVDTTVTATITVRDDGGLTDQCTSYIEVIDNTQPTARCNSPIAAVLDENGEFTVDAENDVDNGSDDNCSIETYSLRGNLASVTYDCGDIGDNPEMLTVTDPSTRSAECSVTVTVSDPNNECVCGQITDPALLCFEAVGPGAPTECAAFDDTIIVINVNLLSKTAHDTAAGNIATSSGSFRLAEPRTMALDVCYKAIIESLSPN